MNINPKVSAAGLAGAVTVILLYILSFWDVEVPSEVAAAITLIISVVAGYLRDQGNWHSQD